MSYVLFTRRFPDPRRRATAQRAGGLSGGQLLRQLDQLDGPSLVGVALANFIPTAWGLGFAGILCLIGILCSLANTPLRILAGVVAGAAAVAA